MSGWAVGAAVGAATVAAGGAALVAATVGTVVGAGGVEGPHAATSSPTPALPALWRKTRLLTDPVAVCIVPALPFQAGNVPPRHARVKHWLG
jgi:hypothetical protein